MEGLSPVTRARVQASVQPAPLNPHSLALPPQLRKSAPFTIINHHRHHHTYLLTYSPIRRHTIHFYSYTIHVYIKQIKIHRRTIKIIIIIQFTSLHFSRIYDTILIFNPTCKSQSSVNSRPDSPALLTVLTVPEESAGQEHQNLPP